MEEQTTTTDAAAILAGTAIGGGFLALPAVTSPLGFLPSVAALTGIWLFLALAGVCYAEATAAVLVAEQAASPSAADEEAPVVSVLSITRATFGDRVSIVCSLAFACQMLAVVTAQVVKGASIAATLTGVPYVAGCLGPSLLVGGFTFMSQPKLVERANTALAGAMVLGFCVLVVSTLSGPSGVTMGAAAMATRLRAANWKPLMPSLAGAARGETWTLPVLLNLLCFGQSVPIVVGRLGTGRSRDLRRAVLLGSAVPLLLCVVWAAVSSLLTLPAMGAAAAASVTVDPLLAMLESPRRCVAVPVAVLSVGAIGTTLIASYLAFSAFCTDATCTLLGRCTVGDADRARVLTVALPALLACGGSGLYLPLLAFAGAFPTTLLYGLVPPLAALSLRRARRRARTAAAAPTAAAPTALARSARLLPGGTLLIGLLVAVAGGFILTSAALAAASLLPGLTGLLSLL